MKIKTDVSHEELIKILEKIGMKRAERGYHVVLLRDRNGFAATRIHAVFSGEGLDVHKDVTIKKKHRVVKGSKDARYWYDIIYHAIEMFNFLKKKKMEAMASKIEVIEMGDSVLCDVCNTDFTNSEESGGFLFGSYAYCPRCAPRGLRTIQETGEERYIRAMCPPDVSFKEFVLGLRAGNNKVIIADI